MNTLSKLSQNTGKNVALTAADAKAGNQEFISRTQAAEVALNTKQAVISSNSAIIDQALSQKIADSYMASEAYNTLKKNQSNLAIQTENLNYSMDDAWHAADEFAEQLVKSSQLDFTSGLKQAAVQGTATILGGVAATLISNRVTGAGGGGLLSMFGRGGANAPGGPSGGSSTLGAPAGVGGNSMITGGASSGMGGGALGGLGGAGYSKVIIIIRRHAACWVSRNNNCFKSIRAGYCFISSPYGKNGRCNWRGISESIGNGRPNYYINI